jgi:hypothetical protein
MLLPLLLPAALLASLPAAATAAACFAAAFSLWLLLIGVIRWAECLHIYATPLHGVYFILKYFTLPFILFFLPFVIPLCRSSPFDLDVELCLLYLCFVIGELPSCQLTRSFYMRQTLIKKCTGSPMKYR